MVDKKFGSIKIDWQKLKVQFSPNINLTSKKNQPTNGTVSNETIIRFEILSDKVDTLECKTYSFESDEIINEEPINKSNPWYFDFCSEELLNKKKEEIIPTSPLETETIKASNKSSLYDSLKKATPEPSKTPMLHPPPSRVKTPDVQPSSKEKTIQQSSISKADTKTIPQPPSISDLQIPPFEPTENKFQTVDEQIKNLEDQLTSTRNIILNLDKRLSAGLFNFNEYLEKKNFLIKKIENIKQQIEKFKKKS